MSLKVAELLATLSVDAKDMTKGVDDATDRAAKSLGKVVDAAAKAGTDAGKGLADGVEKGGASAGKKAADGVETAAPRMKSAGSKLGDSAAQGLASIEVAATKVSKSVADGLEAEQPKVRGAGVKLGDAAGAGLEESTQGIGAGVGGRLDGVFANLIPVGRKGGESVGRELRDGVSTELLKGGGIEGALETALDVTGLSAPAAAAGVALGAAFLKGLADAISHGGEQDILTNRLDNLGGAGIGSASRDLWRQGWGESTAEVNDAIDAVYSTLADSRDSEAAVERISGKFLAMSNVIGVDLSKSVSNAGVLINTGLVKDADEAADLITAGFKRVPEGVRDELADATQEYSQFFAGLGFDGEEAFGVLTTAAQGGTYALDKAGDSIKEFRIRATDMSAATKVGYDILNLSQQEYTDRLLQGGPIAKKAYGEIMDAILSIQDPTMKSQAALALFGTPLEDISGDAGKLDQTLRTLASGGMKDVKGQADDLADAFTNVDSNITIVKRNALGLIEDFANAQLELPAGLIDAQDWGDRGEAIGNWLLDGVKMSFFGPFGGLIDDLPGLDNPWADKPAPKMPAMDTTDWNTTYDKISDRYRTAAGMIVAANKDVSTSVALTEDEVKAFGDQIDNLATSGQAAGLGLGIAKAGADAFLQSVEDSTGLDDMLARTTALFGSTTKLKDSIKNLSSGVDVKGSAEGTVGMFEDTASVLGDVASAGEDAQASIAAALQYQGEEGARAKADDLRTSFEKMFEGRPKEQVHDLLELMGLLPDQIDTAIKVSIEAEDITRIQLLRDSMTTMPKNLALQVQAIIGSGDYATGAELASAYAVDMQDGVLDNPLLIAMNADPTPAQEVVRGFPEWAGEQEQPTLSLDVDPAQAEGTVRGFPAWASGQEQPTLRLGLDTEQAQAEMNRMIAILNDPNSWFTPVAPTSKKSPTGAKKNTTKADLGRGNPNDIDNNPWTPYHSGGVIDDVPVGVEVPIMALGGERVLTIAEAQAYDHLSRPAPARAFAHGGISGSGVAAGAAAAGGSSQPSAVDVGQLAAEVRTLARAVARKGNTYQVNGAQSPVATAEEIDRKQRSDAWVAVG